MPETMVGSEQPAVRQRHWKVAPTSSETESTPASKPNGTVLMPAFGQEYNGPLNDSQINELVIMIQHVDWNEVYNTAIQQNGGYPTPPPAATTDDRGDSRWRGSIAYSGWWHDVRDRHGRRRLPADGADDPGQH